MLGIVTGRCSRSAQTDWGWQYTINERVTKKDGGSFEKYISCSGKEKVAEGEVVTVQGTVESKQNTSKPEYPYTNLIFCQVIARHVEGGTPAAKSDTFEEDIPF